MKTKMTKQSYLMSALLVATIAVATLCSCSFGDMPDEQLHKYYYSQSQVEATLELQAEYGVEFTFARTSIAPLPSLKGIEESCKNISVMKNATKLGSQGNV